VNYASIMEYQGFLYPYRKSRLSPLDSTPGGPSPPDPRGGPFRTYRGKGVPDNDSVGFPRD
jgi:hypothetical protein